MWTTGCICETYDEAIKTIDGFKRYDEKNGNEYKYRIIKETIQEKVIYDD